ncbi:unnamed protein product, partial [Nesidiocoris tenuis]
MKIHDYCQSNAIYHCHSHNIQEMKSPSAHWLHDALISRPYRRRLVQSGLFLFDDPTSQGIFQCGIILEYRRSRGDGFAPMLDGTRIHI